MKFTYLLILSLCFISGLKAENYRQFGAKRNLIEKLANGSLGGYKDENLGQGQFLIKYIGGDSDSNPSRFDSTDTRKQILNYAMRRAAEVASANGYPYFKVLSRESKTTKIPPRYISVGLIPVPIPMVNYTVFLKIQGLHESESGSFNSKKN